MRELSEEYGVTEQAISKHAKKHGWTRNLAGKIQAEADRLIATRLAGGTGNEARTIEVEAQLQADAILAHRADLRQLRVTVQALAAELEHQTGARDLYSRLHEIIGDDSEDADKASPTAKAERALAYKRALGLAGRTKVARDLVECMRQLVATERTVLNIGAQAEAGSFEDFVKRAREAAAEGST